MRILPLLPLILLVWIALFFVGCKSEPVVSHSVGINPHAAKDLMLQSEDVVVLDVRTPREFSRGHINKAVNISIHDPRFPQLVSTLDRAKTYIIHCAINPPGGRVDKSIDVMTELGFENLLSLDGGYRAWQRAGLPVQNT